MAIHSSVLAWRIPGMGESGSLLSMGLHRVRHDWSDLAAAAAEIIRALLKRVVIEMEMRGHRLPGGINEWGCHILCCAKSLQPCPTLCDLHTIAHQAPLSMRFPRQEHWSGLPFPAPGNLLDPGIRPTSHTSPVLAGRFFTTSATREAQDCCWSVQIAECFWISLPMTGPLALIVSISLPYPSQIRWNRHILWTHICEFPHCGRPFARQQKWRSWLFSLGIISLYTVKKTTNNLDPVTCGFFQLRARTTGRSFLKTPNQADFPQAVFAARCRPHFGILPDSRTLPLL